MKSILLLIAILLVSALTSDAQVTQKDSSSMLAPAPVLKRIEDSIRRKELPRKAAIRSAILPGWGQAFNKKYWKIPIVYGALGTTTVVFFFNLKNYRDTRFAYAAKYKASLPAGLRDSTDYKQLDPKFIPIPMESLRFYRNQYRRYIDYSALVFLLLWGLNVVDAAVDAHLKGFDVSPDLSLNFKPGYSPMAGTTGLSIVMTIR